VHRLQLIVALGALAGCDKLWSLLPVPDPLPDATLDGTPDAASNPAGCADRTREGFGDLTAFPMIAGCPGAWTTPGLRPEPAASCGRAAANDGTRAGGAGCTATDLCTEGWHVCRTKLEVYERLPASDRTCGQLSAAANTLFVTAQSGDGVNCDAIGTNDVAGCGTYGIIADMTTCAPLDRTSDNMCFTIKFVGGWECLDPGSELTTIRKTDPTAGGGVLCCRDSLD